MSDQIVHTTDADFAADVLQSEQPVLLDFWAEWCGPCRMIAPILDTIAAEQEGRLRVVKINIDENPRTPMQFNVRSIPMLLLFRGGSVVDQVVGAVPKARLEAFLQPHLDGKGSDGQ